MSRRKPPYPPPSRKLIEETVYLKRPRKGARLREEVWINAADGTVTRYALAYINPKPCPMDNSCLNGFARRCTNDGGRKMKAKPKVIVETGTAEEFFARGRDRAKKLDKGERLKREIRVTFEDPEALAQVLTGERIRLLKACRQKPRPMVKLAFTLRRDRTAVRRDVRILESFGLLRTREESNPGHGRVKIVEPLAEKVLVSASI